MACLIILVPSRASHFRQVNAVATNLSAFENCTKKSKANRLLGSDHSARVYNMPRLTILNVPHLWSHARSPAANLLNHNNLNGEPGTYTGTRERETIRGSPWGCRIKISVWSCACLPFPRTMAKFVVPREHIGAHSTSDRRQGVLSPLRSDYAPVMPAVSVLSGNPMTCS